MSTRQMSDDEIRACIRANGEIFGAKIAALTNVIQMLQAQPSYDHQHFLTVMAAYQVGLEGRPPPSPIFLKSYQDALESFAKKPRQPPPRLRKLGQP